MILQTDNRTADAPPGSLHPVVTPPTPYHEQDGIRIFCGDNRQIAPLLGEYDLLHTDPPYGIGADNHHKWKAGGKAVAPKRNYGDGQWDAEPAPEWLLSLVRSK